MRPSTMLLTGMCCAILSGMPTCPAQERALYSAPENQRWCRGGYFPHEGPHFGLARVTAEKAHFVKDDDPCPSGSPACAEKAYLVKGDLVATSRNFGQWTCSAYPKGGRTDWLKSSDLAVVPVESRPVLTAWQGRWINGNGSGFNTINLVPGKGAGTLAVDGHACWGEGCRHQGSVSANARPQGNAVAFLDDDGGCKLSLVLLGNYLVATDNDQCGGMNVSFSDVYWRQDAEKKNSN
jgi:hypothetical protein